MLKCLTVAAAAVLASGAVLAVPAAADSYSSVHVKVGHYGHHGHYKRYGPPPHAYGFHKQRHVYKHRPYRHRHHGSGAGDVLLGVGVGFLLYNAIDNARRPEPAYAPYYPPARPYAPPPVVRRTAHPPRYAPPPAPRDGFAGADCLQTREYTTTIVIGGREQDAYGTACLQPDGSWLKGAPTPVPAYP